MSELVIMEGSKIFTTSMIISENIKIEHESVVFLIKKHSNIEELSRVAIGKLSTKGRAIINYLLTEEQALILVSLMKNTPEVIKFKVGLVKGFIKYRKIAQNMAIQKNNAEYVLERQQGKLIRRECTDVIKSFIEYAIRQGSTNAMRYYINISKMEINALFLIEQKFPNIREALNIRQLNLLKCADEAVQQSLIDGMAENLNYKEIYRLAKSKVEAIAKIFPRSTLPALLSKDFHTE